MKETIIKHFFAPVKTRYRLLLVLPMLNLLVLGIVLLFLKAPKEAILLSMAGICFVVFLAGSPKFVSLFYISSLLFNLMIFFITWSSESPWAKVWSLSMMLTLTLGYFLTSELLEYYSKEEKASSDVEKEKGLWKNRFETLRDAHNLETVGLEEELVKGKEELKEKTSQIEALEKLVEVTHKEASILAKKKHELIENLKCQSDQRNDEEVVRQNIFLQKELEGLKLIESDVKALQQEKIAFTEKISTLQEKNRLLEQSDQSENVKKLQKEIISLKEELDKKVVDNGYSKEQIFSMIEELNFFRTEKFQLDQVTQELKEKIKSLEKPFKWQVWKGEKKEKKVVKNKISVTDLGKGLKI